MYRHPPPPPKPEEPLFVPTRAIWPFLAAAAIALGVGGFFLHRFLTAPEPLEVLIAIDFYGTPWSGSEPSVELADKLADRLAKLGFAPVRIDPETRATLAKAKSPLDAAESMHASFVVTGKLTPALIEHPIAGGYFELRTDASIEVRHVRDARGTEVRVAGFAGSKQKADGPKLLARALADKSFDAVLGGMARHPSVVALFEGGGDPYLAGRVTLAREYLKARDRSVRRAAALTDEVRDAHAKGEKGPVPVTYHGPFTAQDSLSGASPGGVLVKTADITPFFSPDTRDLGYYESLETLEWRPFTTGPDGAGAGKKQLWSGYHVFSYAAAAPEGAPAVFVEDIFGWAKTITVVDGAGASKRLRVDPSHRYIGPRVAPGGKAAAIYDRDCQKCPDGLLVLSLEDGATLFKTEADEGRISGYAWIDARRLAFAQLPMGTLTQVIRVVDVGVKPAAVSPLFRAKEEEWFVVSAASAGGAKLAIEIHGARPERLGVLDTLSTELTRHDVGGGAAWPTFSPDGKSITFELTPTDTYRVEIAILDLAGGKTRVLTENPFEDHYPVFSADGSRIFYETRTRDRSFPSRPLSVIASVPARP